MTKLGSISSGTHDTESLLAAFTDALESSMSACGATDWQQRELIKEARAWITLSPVGELADCDAFQSVGADMVRDLQDYLSEFAGPYAYFGASQGDGADFGFWFDSDAFETARSDGELPTFDDTGKAEEAEHVGEFCVVSDHGNVSIYCREQSGEVREIISIV